MPPAAEYAPPSTTSTPPDAGALRAATDAFNNSRRGATSTPARRRQQQQQQQLPIPSNESFYALSAAEASQKTAAQAEATAGDRSLDNFASSVEASRIQHVPEPNPELYTATPPPQEPDSDTPLQAAVTSWAREMYPPLPGEEPAAAEERKDAVSAARLGVDRGRAQGAGSAADDPQEAFKRAVRLQSAAQKIAADKLAMMQYEDVYHDYYGTAQQPQSASEAVRSRLPLRLRRSASDGGRSSVDLEQSRGIRNQMTSLHTRLNRLDERRLQQDEKRQHDRDELMEVARRNVHATMDRLDSEVYANKGIPSPQQQREWDEVARERVRREAEGAQPSGLNLVHIGAHQYMDRANVEAIARSRLEPTLAEVNEWAGEKRERDLEQELDKEEEKLRETRERLRDADTRAEEKRLKGVSFVFCLHLGDISG